MVHHPRNIVCRSQLMPGDMDWQKALASPCHHPLGLQIANDLSNHIDELSIRLFVQA